MASSSTDWAIRLARLGGLGPAAKFRLRPFSGQVRRTLALWVFEESGRFILMVPCLLAAGVLAWLALAAPPPLVMLVVLFAVFAGLWGLSIRQRNNGAMLLSRAAACFLLGMALMGARTERIDAPLIPQNFAPATVTGTLVRVEDREKDHRYTVDVHAISGLDDQSLPRRVRVVWRGTPADVRPGDVVSFRASLAPPPGPALPGGYDYGRWMRYQGIGGSGFAYSAPQVVRRGGTGFMAGVEALRTKVADRAEAVIGGPAGALAAALMTGQRTRIPPDAVDALRDAGLAHLLAISGLHMGLVSGFMFWTLRYLLSRSAWLALHVPIKKWAAGGALLGAAGYLFLSGAAWSAQRAFIMVAIVFLAILFDRRGISLRNAALAAIIIIVWRPEAVMSAGFQMSFAAVVTLIAAFSWLEGRMPRDADPDWWTKSSRFIGGLLLTSFLAGLATGPFAIHHFGRLASFGLLANMLAMPIVTLAIMPALVLSLFLMPLGLDAPLLFLVGQGIDLVLNIAQWTSGLPGAVQLFPQLAPAGLLFASWGLLVLALLRSPLRLGGLVLLGFAVPLSHSLPPADVYISRDLRNVGVRQVNGEASLLLLSKRRDRFSAEAWLQALGRPQNVPAQDVMAACAGGSCRVPLPTGQVLAVIDERSLLRAACEDASIVVLRARRESDQTPSCGALILALDHAGHHPPATLTWTKDTWALNLAKQGQSRH